MSSIATLPESGPKLGPGSGLDAGPDSSPGGAAPPDGARLHWWALEGLHESAPINRKFALRLDIVEESRARIGFDVTADSFHAAGAAHGTIYFKMLDDAAFYATNTLVTDHFLLTTSFNLQFPRPDPRGPSNCRWALEHWAKARVRHRIKAHRRCGQEDRPGDRHLHAIAHRVCGSCRLRRPPASREAFLGMTRRRR